MMLIRAVAYREGDAWVAQALEYDIGAQANDLNVLQARFEATVIAELAESLRRFGNPFQGIDPAPEYFQKMWNDDHPPHGPM